MLMIDPNPDEVNAETVAIGWQRSSVAIAIARELSRVVDRPQGILNAFGQLAVRVPQPSANSAAVYAAAKALADADGRSFGNLSDEAQARYLDRAIACCAAFERHLREGCEASDRILLDQRDAMLGRGKTLGDRVSQLHATLRRAALRSEAR